MGASVSAARKNAPFLNGNIVPSFERVPSGKMKMFKPLRSASAATDTLCAASSREPPRVTGTNLPIRIAVPNKGIFINDFLRKTLFMPGSAGSRMGGSKFETWLLRKMQDSPTGTFSRPSTRTIMPLARTPRRRTAIPHLYIVLKFRRSADQGIPIAAAGAPNNTNTNNILKAANISTKNSASLTLG